MKNLFLIINNLSLRNSFLVIILLGFLVYSNSLFNSFAADDYPVIFNNTFVHSAEIYKFFNHGTFDDEGTGNANNYYKPLFPATLSILWVLGNGQPFLFHLFQISLHVVNSLLVFLLLKRFFKKPLALFLSLLFLIHPMNVEAVSYASAIQDVLFLFFGLFALYIFIKRQEKKYTKYFTGILILFSLLSKETGIIFLIIIPLYALFFSPKKIKESVLISTSVFLLYVFLRFGVAHIFFNELKSTPIMTLSLPERLLSIPKIIFFYIKTFLFPVRLIMFQDWTVRRISLQDLFIPISIDLFFAGTLVIIGRKLYKHNEKFKIFLFFCLWFLVGIGIHLQIIPLDQTVSDRWFYFPMIGLLGIMGISFSSFKSLEKKNLQPVIIFFCFLLLTFLSARTFIRSFDWRSDSILIKHDAKLNPDSYQIQDSLGAIYYRENNLPDSEKHYTYSSKLFPTGLTYANLGYFYFLTGRKEKALDAFTTSLSLGGHYRTYYNLSILLYSLKKPQESLKVSSEGIKKYPNYSALWIAKALAEKALGNHTAALEAAEKAVELDPTESNSNILNAIENNKKIEITSSPD